jgi:plastocyanin
VFEYTDFFSRDVRVHPGDTVNFQAAAGSFHIIALATSEQAARAAYPVLSTDRDDPNAPNGAPKIALGLSNFPITGGSTHGGGQIAFDRPGGPPVCGAAGEAPCTFRGGDDVEVAGPNPGFDAQGNPVSADWNVHITAPVGTYHYFCYIHPGMRGTLRVVKPGQQASTQAQVDAVSRRLFEHDRQDALAAERQADKVRFTGGKPGHRTYDVRVGIAAAHLHVAVLEMLPNRPLSLTPGDRVRYRWVDPHEAHTVTFPESNDLPPFGFDCGGTSYSPEPSPTCTEPGEEFGPFPTEFIGDPGNAPPGTVLTSPTAVVDSGVLVGTAYHAVPSVQRWSVATELNTTAPGAYTFHCTIHDWMAGTLAVG